MAEAENNECFIVSVIGKKGSEQRKHADWFLSGVVTPVFEQHFPDIKVIRADGMKTPGMITSQIVEKLLHSRLVIADMTYLNPNVFYEIGIRHMTAKPIVHAHHEGEAIPFDVSPYLSMEYSLDEHQQMIDAQQLLKELAEKALLPGHTVDNPVTQARGRAKFDETATPPDKVLLSQIEALAARMGVLERAATPPKWSFSERHGQGEDLFAGGAILRTVKPLSRQSARPSIQQIQVTNTDSLGDRRVLADFMDSVIKVQSDSLKVHPSDDGQVFTILYNTDSMDPDVLNLWQNQAEKLGLAFIRQ